MASLAGLLLLTLPDAAAIEEDLEHEGGIQGLVVVQDDDVAAQGQHSSGVGHRVLAKSGGAGGEIRLAKMRELLSGVPRAGHRGGVTPGRSPAGHVPFRPLRWVGFHLTQSGRTLLQGAGSLVAVPGPALGLTTAGRP